MRICYEESGYSSSEFSGNGLAFVYPVALPSEQNFRDGHDKMPAALELYNISHGYRDAKSGQLFKPPNRGWAEIHRCELRSPCHCLWLINFKNLICGAVAHDSDASLIHFALR